jgi:hypothetical protein
MAHRFLTYGHWISKRLNYFILFILFEYDFSDEVPDKTEGDW